MSMFAIPAALLVVGGGLAALRNWQGASLAAILLGNWAACALFWRLTTAATEWSALAAFDYCAAILVLLAVPVSRPMLAIVMFYAGMLLCHVAYGAGGALALKLSAASYFWALTYLAWGQVAVLGGWLAVGAYRMGRARADANRRARADRAVPDAVAAEP